MAVLVPALIKQRLDAGVTDIDGITGAVVTDIINAGDAETHLYSLVRPQVASMVRAVAREAEQNWDRAERTDRSAQQHGHRSNDTRNAAVKSRLILVETEFHAPGFGMVKWGDALVVHHKAAQDASQKLAAANTADAERHGRALRDLDAAGVRCLRDIPDWLEENWLAQAA